MADKKISALTTASVPLAGTEVLPIVQSSSTVKVSRDGLIQPIYISGNNVGVGISPTFSFHVFGTGAVGGMLAQSNVAGATSFTLKQSISGVSNSGVSLRNEDSAYDWLRFTATGGDVSVQTGSIIMGTAGKGIDFSANTHAAGMTSELLNDYEEGTWTPSFSDSGGGVPTQTSAGRYVKVGSVVHFWFQCVLSAPALDVYFTTDFPFTPLTTTSAGSSMLNTGVGIFPVLGIDDGRLRAFVNVTVTTFYGSGSIRV